MKIKHVLLLSSLFIAETIFGQITPIIRTSTGCQTANEEITIAGAGKITQINITNNSTTEPIIVGKDEFGLYEVATSQVGPFVKTNLSLSGTNITIYARANPTFANMGNSNINQISFYNVSTPNTKTYFDFYTNVATNLGIPNPEIEISFISSPNLGVTNQLRLNQFQSETVTGFIDIKIPTIAGGVTISARGTTNDFQYLIPTNPNAFKAFEYIKISTIAGMDFVNVPANFTVPSNFNGRLRFQALVPASEDVKPYILLFTINGTNLQTKEFSVATGAITEKISINSISGLNNTLNTSFNTSITSFEVKTVTIVGPGGNQFFIETASWIGVCSTLSSNINDYVARSSGGSELQIPGTGGTVYFANISTIVGVFNNETSAQYAATIRRTSRAGNFNEQIKFSGTTTRPVDFIAITNPIDANLNAEQRINNFNGDRIGTQFYRTLVQGITKNPVGVSNVIALSILGTGIANAITVAGVTTDNFNNTEDFGYRVATSASGTYLESITLPPTGGVAYIRFDATLPSAMLINNSNSENSIQIFADNNRTRVYFTSSVNGMPRILPMGIGQTKILDIGYRSNQKGYGYQINNSFPNDRISINAISFGGENFTGPITLTSGYVGQFSISQVQSISLTETGGYTSQLIINKGDVIYTKAIVNDVNGTPTFEDYSIVATAAKGAKSVINLNLNAGLPTTMPQIVLPTPQIDFVNKSSSSNKNVTFIDNYSKVEIIGYSLPSPITLTGKFFTKISTSAPTVWSSVAVLPASGGTLYVANDKQVLGGYCSSITLQSGTLTSSINVSDFANVVATLSGVTDRIILPITNISTHQSTNFSVYPNPSTGIFAIVSDFLVGVNDIKVYDLVGLSQSFTLTENELTIAKSGIYFVHLGRKVVKVVIL